MGGWRQLECSGGTEATCSLFGRPALVIHCSAALHSSQVYGSGPFSLAGFPPWLARSAEIMHVGRRLQAQQGGGAGRASFQAAIERFAGVRQRFGR